MADAVYAAAVAVAASSPVGPFLARRFHVKPSSVGLVAALYSLGVGLLAPLVARGSMVGSTAAAAVCAIAALLAVLNGDAASREPSTPPSWFRFWALGALALWSVCIISQLGLATIAAQGVESFQASGVPRSQLPGPTLALVTLGPWLLSLVLAADVAVFWAFYALAKRYGTALLFGPVALFALGWVLLVVLLRFAPLPFEVRTLVT